MQRACDEVSGSSAFRKILGIILKLGNRMNTAGPASRDKARAISLASLRKLNQGKAFDKKTTFMHYLVMVVKRNNPLLLNFKDDLPTLFKAEKAHWQLAVSEFERLENDLDEVRRIALQSCPDGGDDAHTLRSGVLSVTREVEILQDSSVGRFTLDAHLRMAAVVNEIQRSRKRFERALSYFGESSNTEMNPDEMFQILGDFCRSFDVASDEVAAREKAKVSLQHGC